MVVEKSVKEVANSQIELTITVDAASLDKAYEEKIAKYAKTIEMPGFRRGHVPASVIERKFGQDIRNEASYDKMEEELKAAIDTLSDDQKPLSFSTPVLQDEENLKFEKGQDVTFKVLYDVLPKFELPAYTGLEVEVDNVEVADEDVEEEVKRLQEQNSMVRSKDGKAENGDIITIDYAELDENGKVVESTERKDFTFTIGSGYNFYKLDNDVIGMAKDDEKVVEKSYTEEDNVPGYEGKTIKLNVKCTAVKTRELPAIDDEFAQDVKDEYKTVADLKAGIKADLLKEIETAQKSEKSEAIIEKIASNVEIALPQSMIDFELEQSWKRFVQQSQLPEEQLMAFFKMQNQTKESIMEAWRPNAEKDLKFQLILDEIKKKENFEVNEEEFKKACDEQLKSVTDENTRKYYEEMIKDDMQFSMVMPFLLEKNTFKNGKTLSYKEYKNKGSVEE